MITRTLGILIVALATVQGSAFAFTPKPTRFGAIQDFLLQEEVALQWEEESFGPTPALQDGQKFAVVQVKVDAGKSIGKYDYTLSGAKCLALSTGDSPFDPAKWEQVQEQIPGEARLLYVVSEADAPFYFALTYQVPSLDEQGAVLGVVEEVAAEEPEAEPAAAEPAAVEEPVAEEAPAAPPAEQAIAEPAPPQEEEKVAPEPEKKPEPAPKPEPKPAPKEEKKPVQDEVIW